jgi:hypothetical protein
VVICGIVLLAVIVELNVHSITAVANEVANHCLTFEVVCRAFIDRLDVFVILKGVKCVIVMP